jgi:chorismate-pyruvate lyase
MRELRDYLALPPFLRVLLVTDGTVTRSLEAYFAEPIDVEVLTHAESRSSRSYPALDIATGDPIVHRRVTLRGGNTRTVYAFAESIVVLARVSPEMRRKLIEEKTGIGELLIESRSETYRQLVAINRSEAGEWAAYLLIDSGASVVTRTYEIHMGGRATIQIEEVFPESRFAPAD